MYQFFNGRAFVSGAAANAWATTRPVAGSSVVGTSKNDQLVDNVGGVTLSGGLGDDIYLIMDSNSLIRERAGEGIDSVVAYTHFRLTSNIEKLTLQGNLITGIASDTGSLVVSTGERNNLVSGIGDDILSDETNNKQNIFVFHESSGNDVIYNFQALGTEHDLLRIDRAGFMSFDDVKTAMKQVDGDVLLTFNATDAVLLKGVSISDLTSDNFLLRFSPSGLALTFSDEFDNLSLYDVSTGTGTWKPAFEHGPAYGWGSLWARTLPSNGEQQLYVDPAFAGDPNVSKDALGINPFSVNDGVLSIHADRLTDEQSSKLWGYKFSSGVLTTAPTFAQTYGYFEIRAELPLEKGMFPAFWLLPTAPVWPPEIDIFENVGADFVSGGAITATEKDAFYTYFPDGLTGMHTYGLLWNEKAITWYVDGMAVGSIATPESMHQDMYLIFNLAVGGNWAGSADASFDGADLRVDYVRVYSLDAARPARPSLITADVTTTLADGATDLLLTGTAAIDGTGNALANSLTGNDANNLLRGLDSDDRLLGMGGTDRLYGGNGNDVMDGGSGVDLMWGGLGDDIYHVDVVQDRVYENPGEGVDWIHANANITIAANVENLLLLGEATKGFGNELANTIIGNDSGNWLYGYAGDDVLDGRGGNDVLDGGEGANTLIGGAGDDVYLVRGLTDVVIERTGEGRDEVRAFVSGVALADNVEVLSLQDLVQTGSGNALDNEITGNIADNKLYGLAGNDVLYGRVGADYLDGGVGDDILDGGKGIDTMVGGLGDDIYYVDITEDIIVERAGEGYDSVYSSASYWMPEHVEKLVLVDTAKTGAGNASDNVVIGNATANTLSGKDGNDWIDGGAGNDVLLGELGNDILFGGNGNDRLDGGNGNDQLSGGPGNDTFVFGWSFGNDVVTDFGKGDTLDFTPWLNARVPVSIFSSGTDTQISIMGNIVTLLGVTPEHLQATATGFTFV